jgi:hypothetical protein
MTREVEPLCSGLGRTGDFFHQTAEVWLLDRIEPSGAVFGWETPSVQRVANKGAVAGAVVSLQFGEGDDFIDDAWQLKASFGAINLQRKNAPIEIVQGLIENADEPHVLAACVLQMSEPADHFLAHQPIRATAVRLASLLRISLWLTLAPLQAQASGHGDGVNEYGVVLVQRRRGAEACAHGIEVGLAVRLVVAQCWVRAADENGEIATLLPSAGTDRVPSPALYGQIPGLEIKEQRSRRFQSPELRCFSDATLADENTFGRALSPWHTTKKNGRRYRYYVPQRDTKEHAGASGLPRLPAAELESAVLDQLRAILRAPNLLGDMLPQAIKLDPTLDEAKITVAMTRLDAIWGQMFPVEQSRIVKLLVEKVIVSPNDLEVRLRANGIERLVLELRPEPTNQAAEALA